MDDNDLRLLAPSLHDLAQHDKGDVRQFTPRPLNLLRLLAPSRHILPLPDEKKLVMKRRSRFFASAAKRGHCWYD